MVVFNKFGAIITALVAIVCAAVPMMVEHTPDAVLSGLRDWLWLLYPVFGLSLVYTAMTVGFFLGARSKTAVSPTPVVMALPADAQGRTLDDLIYAIRTITSALLEDGELRVGEAENYAAHLRRPHRAWHDQARHQARDDFLLLVRRAVEARELKSAQSWMAGGGRHFGDFPPNEREAFHADLKKLRDDLVGSLEALRALDYAPDPLAGPMLIEGI